MAKNFRIFTRERNRQRMSLELAGDFDASSALELIHVLDKGVRRSRKVAINTDGLRTVNAFGLDVWLPRMSGLDGCPATIEITSRFSGVFQDA